MSFIDYFDSCQIINLPYRKDRAKVISNEVKHAGMPLRTGKVELFPGIRPADAGPFPSVGAHGCFMSHLSILRKAHAEGLRNILVIEDDLAISDRFADVADRLVEQLQDQDWGFAYFGHELDLPKPEDVPSLIAYGKPIVTAHFYAINGPLLERLLTFFDALLQRPPGHPDGSPMHVDGAYSTFRMQNPDVLTLVANPSLGWQRSSRSDIYPNQWFDRWPLVREMVALLRPIKAWFKALRKP